MMAQTLAVEPTPLGTRSGFDTSMKSYRPVPAQT